MYVSLALCVLITYIVFDLLVDGKEGTQTGQDIPAGSQQGRKEGRSRPEDTRLQAEASVFGKEEAGKDGQTIGET